MGNLQLTPTPKNRMPAQPVFIDHSRDLTGLDQSTTVQGSAGPSPSGVKIAFARSKVSVSSTRERRTIKPMAFLP